MKKLIMLFIVYMTLFTSAPAAFFCMPYSCDPSIIYAMTKQRNTIKTRLNDLIGAIKSNTKATKDQAFLITYEIKAYRRLKERLKIEFQLLSEAQYISQSAAISAHQLTNSALSKFKFIKEIK